MTLIYPGKLKNRDSDVRSSVCSRIKTHRRKNVTLSSSNVALNVLHREIKSVESAVKQAAGRSLCEHSDDVSWSLLVLTGKTVYTQPLSRQDLNYTSCALSSTRIHSVTDEDDEKEDLKQKPPVD